MVLIIVSSVLSLESRGANTPSSDVGNKYGMLPSTNKNERGEIVGGLFETLSVQLKRNFFNFCKAKNPYSQLLTIIQKVRNRSLTSLCLFQ